MASTTRQAVPMHSIQSASPTAYAGSGGGGGINVQRKMISVNSAGNAGIRMKPGTTVKITSGQGGNKRYTTVPIISSNGALSTPSSSLSPTIIPVAAASATPTPQQQVRRPTIFIKGPPKKSLRTITMELIDKSPKLHLGISSERLQILKSTVCQLADISYVDLYMTLKKLRHNEDFNLLSQYFEYPTTIATISPQNDDISNVNNNTIIQCNNDEIINIFIRTICKLSKYLKYLICWPDGKKYYDRHKNLPMAYRFKLSYVQSLVECVETELQSPLSASSLATYVYSSSNCDGLNDGVCGDSDNGNQIITIPFPSNLKSYKYILSMTPNGVITYVSDACAGYYDDLTVFNACKFNKNIPNYLTLVADPGCALRRKQKSTIDKNQMHKRMNTTKNRNVSDDDQCSKTDNCETDEHHSNDYDTDDDDDDDDGVIIDVDGDDNDENRRIKLKQNQTSPPSVLSTLKNHIPSSNRSINLINNQLTSNNVKNFKISTLNVNDSICRSQITQILLLMREFKIIQPYTILEPQLYSYINEIIVTISALVNLQR